MTLRILLVLVLAVAWAGRAEAAITVPDTCSAEDSNGDAVVSCALTGVLPGDLIVCYGTQNDATRTATCTDTLSSSYSATTYGDFVGGDQVSFSCAVAATSGNPTVTITLDLADFKAIVVFVLRGAANCTTVDSDTSHSTGFTASTPALTTDRAGYSTAVMRTAGTTTITSGNSYTTFEENENSDAAGSWNGQGIATSAASTVTPAWTLGTSSDWIAFGHTFNEAAKGRFTLLGVGP